MQEDEQQLKDNYAPTQQRWSASALDAWEAKVDEEIKAFLIHPCKYYGPDMDF